MRNTQFTPQSLKVVKTLNISDCVKTAHKAARIFGLLPYTINYSSRGEIVSSSIRSTDIVWFVISLTICILFAIFGSSSLTPTSDIRTTVLLLGSRIILICNVLLAVVSIILDALNQNRLINLLKKISEFDKSVKNTFYISYYFILYLNNYWNFLTYYY